MNDAQCIKDSLAELGYEFEEHEQAQQLYGYEGALRQQKAHIIVRRKHVGAAANDVGFLKLPNGGFQLIISEYDRDVNGEVFMHKIKQVYGSHMIAKVARKKGYRIKSKEVDQDGRMKIKIRCG